MQDRLDAIHLKLGELEGRQKEQANVLKEISKSLAILASNTTKVEELDKARIQHDKRIVLLENTCSARGVTIGKLETHADSDIPIEHYVGAVALKILLVIGGLAGGWIISRLPKIMELLK